MKIEIIVAMDENNLIGVDGTLPWRAPEDLQHFRRTTMGHPIVMGRKTRDSLPHALPGRENIVITRNRAYRRDDSEVVGSLEEALKWAREIDADRCFIIGGAEIYAEALPLTDVIHETLVLGTYEGDSWFPSYDEKEWLTTNSEKALTATGNPTLYFLTHIRR